VALAQSILPNAVFTASGRQLQTDFLSTAGPAAGIGLGNPAHCYINTDPNFVGASPLQPHQIIKRLEELRDTNHVATLSNSADRSQEDKRVELWHGIRDLWSQIQSMKDIEPFLEVELGRTEASPILSFMLFLRLTDFLTEADKDHVLDCSTEVYSNALMPNYNMGWVAAARFVKEWQYHQGGDMLSAVAADASRDDHYLGRIIAANIPGMARIYGISHPWLDRVREEGLSDDETLVVDAAYYAHRHANIDITPSHINEDELFSRPSHVINKSPLLGIDRYLHLSGERSLPRTHLLMKIFDDSPRPPKYTHVPVTSIRPIHSLADYQPDSGLRQDLMESHYRRLKGLIGKHGLNRRIIITTLFNFEGGTNQGLPPVIRFGPSQYYLANGHHRVAAFIKAALDGIIPREWLNKPIPVLRTDFNDPHMPPQLARYFLTLGVKLSWQDLFPGRTDFTGLPNLTERGFARESQS